MCDAVAVLLYGAAGPRSQLRLLNHVGSRGDGGAEGLHVSRLGDNRIQLCVGQVWQMLGTEAALLGAESRTATRSVTPAPTRSADSQGP
jgi:hypothetical protein